VPFLPDPHLAFPVPGSKIDLRYSILKEHAPLLGIIDKALKAIDPVVMMEILRKWGVEQRATIELSADELAWLEEKHTVRVRIGDHPPWEVNSPEAAGMAVDYLRIIAKLFDIDFRFVPAADSWAEGFADMAGAHRDYDLLPAAKRTDARLATLAMSEDYLTSPWTIFTRKDTRDIHDLIDLRGRTVAVERGYVMQGLLEATEPAIVLSVQESTREALLAVSSGSADAYVGNLIVTDYLMQADGIVNLKVAGPTPFGEHKQAMVTRKAWAPLISLIDKGLRSMPAEQHIAIRQRWLASVADGGVQAPLDLSDEERAWLAANPTIRVGAYALPPYVQERNGRADGYLVELLRATAARVGLRAEFHFESLAQVLEDIAGGRLDAILAVNPSKERESLMVLSGATSQFVLKVLARKEDRDIQGAWSPWRARPWRPSPAIPGMPASPSSCRTRGSSPPRTSRRCSAWSPTAARTPRYRNRSPARSCCAATCSPASSPRPMRCWAASTPTWGTIGASPGVCPCWRQSWTRPTHRCLRRTSSASGTVGSSRRPAPVRSISTPRSGPTWTAPGSAGPVPRPGCPSTSPTPTARQRASQRTTGR
jgi:ABC-type amino acid transport substrate-binding protein